MTVADQQLIVLHITFCQTRDEAAQAQATMRGNAQARMPRPASTARMILRSHLSLLEVTSIAPLSPVWDAVTAQRRVSKSRAILRRELS
jgi:hypothetical protein